jgi:phosphoribosylaminoimidazole-succinocarboxamide synthase
MQNPIDRTRLEGLSLVKRGKVRDLYEVGDDLLIVSTDRLSAFDVVFEQGIPGKGHVLTALTEFWFRELPGIVPNHLLTTDLEEMPPEVRRHREVLEGRSMLVRKARVLPVECIARGYLAGSGHRDYLATGKVCGIELPPGLHLSSRLPKPVYTPSTKAEEGHDENISFDSTVEVVGRELAETLRDRTLSLFRAGSELLAAKGIILCDTKFEFGIDEDGSLLLVDEALTPDSSRFWDAEKYVEGVAQDSFDKQIVRDYLSTLDWDKTPPPPPLPEEVVERTARRYREIAERILGHSMED